MGTTNGMDESEARQALEDLGLTSYEAQVFIALQKLGTGTASDIDRIADVPRSQVYSAAEKLEDRGLCEVQQSSPIRYRPVGLDEARDRLHRRYEDREAQAFEYLESVKTDRPDLDDEQEAVWTIQGRETVTDRAIQLVSEADERVLYGGGPETVTNELVTALIERARVGVSTEVVSASPDVLDRFADEEGVSTVAFPTDLTATQETGRILVVDEQTVLLSVVGNEAVPGGPTETAIWSAETGFAAVIIQLLLSWLDQHID